MNPTNQSAEKIEALLLELLDPIRHCDDTLMHFEIDCHTLAEPIWGTFVASLSRNELRELKNWSIIQSKLSALVRATLSGQSANPTSPNADNKSAQIHTEAPLQTLGAWLERLVDMMRAIDQRSLQILALRIEGFDNRDISEQLETGLRCVQRITQEMQFAWNEEALETN